MHHPSYLRLHRELAQLAKLKQPHLELAKKMDSVLQPYRQQQRLLSQQLAQIAKISDMAKASQSLASAFKTLQAAPSSLVELAKIHKSWTNHLLPTQRMLNDIQNSARLTLGTASYVTAIAERFKTQIDFTKLTKAFNIETGVACRLGTMIESAENSFSQLASSLSGVAELTTVPSIVIPSASREILTAEYAILKLCPDTEQAGEDDYSDVITDVREETSGVGSLVRKVNPKLADAYQGARDAFRNKNADYARHVLSSLREMWNNLIWTLAPNEQIMSWIGDSGDYLHEGKPTRRARIDYICREFNHAPLSQFMLHDTKAFVEMIGFFNRVHQLDNGLTDSQLRALILRSDSWLMFILQIAFAEEL